MTKIQNPIIGRARGSAGGMTFAKNYDKNVMRSKPFEVKNPKTQGQTTQRTYFAVLSGLVATFTAEHLRTLFPNMPKAMSRRNALSKQLAEDVSIAGNVKSIDFANINTIGNAGTMDFGTTTCSQVGTTISVGLDAAVRTNTMVNNNIFCVALVNETLGEIAMPTNAALVSVGTLSIDAPNGWLATHALHAIPLVLDSKDSSLTTVSFGTMMVTKRPARA